MGFTLKDVEIPVEITQKSKIQYWKLWERLTALEPGRAILVEPDGLMSNAQLRNRIVSALRHRSIKDGVEVKIRSFKGGKGVYIWLERGIILAKESV